MTATRPPAPTTAPAVGPATCAAAAHLADSACRLLLGTRISDGVHAPVDVAPDPEQRAEAARLLRAAAELVDIADAVPTPRTAGPAADPDIAAAGHVDVAGESDAPSEPPVCLARPPDAQTPLGPRGRRRVVWSTRGTAASGAARRPTPLDLDPRRRADPC